jgi:hypothetical protein
MMDKKKKSVSAFTFQKKNMQEENIAWDALSVYSDDTIRAANCAFLAIEDGDFTDEVAHWVQYAAEHGEKYSMASYGFMCIGTGDASSAELGVRYMLKAAVRGEERAMEWIHDCGGPTFLDDLMQRMPKCHWYAWLLGGPDPDFLPDVIASLLGLDGLRAAWLRAVFAC